MNDITYPATAEEYEEYCAVMEEMADEAEASAPDPMPPSFKTADVSDLSFERICDDISHKWADWEVKFRYNGKPYTGILGGCPRHPDLMHDDKIEDCELDY